MRVEQGSYKQVHTGNGVMYLHRRGDSSRPPSSLAIPYTVLGQRADAATLDQANRYVLEALTLSPAHVEQLVTRRGLSEETITRRLYATVSADDVTTQITAALSHIVDLATVPGFYQDEGRWRIAARPGDLLVPIADHKGRIVAMQTRSDVGRYRWLSCPDRRVSEAASDNRRSPSSGTPIHFANPHRTAFNKTLVITEGPLKADVISERMNVAVAAFPGVGAFGETIGLRIRQDLPFVEIIFTAFDADYRENVHVRDALRRLLQCLVRADYAVEVMTWSPELGKGLDDVLVAGEVAA